MPSFLSNIENFRGTGQVNEQGQTLEEFLEVYNADKYKKPSVTADVMVFSYQKEQKNLLQDLKLLMIKRRNHPSIGFWALPGGFAEMREDLVDTAKRELEEETGLTGIPLMQLYTFGDMDRDPRDRVVTAAYVAFVEDGTLRAKAGDDAAEAEWWSVDVKALETNKTDKSEIKEYQLCMRSQGEQDLTAVVIETTELVTPLRISEFKVKESQGIAFDHARYIVQAYAYLDNKLN